MKNYQISGDLFLKLIHYFLLQDADENDFDEISKMLETKLDQIVKRDLYSKQFDKALTAAEKESARQKYLDMIGMSDSFRY